MRVERFGFMSSVELPALQKCESFVKNTPPRCPSTTEARRLRAGASHRAPPGNSLKSSPGRDMVARAALRRQRQSSGENLVTELRAKEVADASLRAVRRFASSKLDDIDRGPFDRRCALEVSREVATLHRMRPLGVLVRVKLSGRFAEYGPKRFKSGVIEPNRHRSQLNGHTFAIDTPLDLRERILSEHLKSTRVLA